MQISLRVFFYLCEDNSINTEKYFNEFRPQTVRNRCVIEVFCGVCELSCCFLGVSVAVGAFVIGLSQISSFSSLIH